MPGPGTKSPEDQVEQMINDETIDTEELSRGTEVYEEEGSPVEEEEIQELEFEDPQDDFDDDIEIDAADEDFSYSGEDF